MTILNATLTPRLVHVGETDGLTETQREEAVRAGGEYGSKCLPELKHSRVINFGPWSYEVREGRLVNVHRGGVPFHLAPLHVIGQESESGGGDDSSSSGGGGGSGGGGDNSGNSGNGSGNSADVHWGGCSCTIGVDCSISVGN